VDERIVSWAFEIWAKDLFSCDKLGSLEYIWSFGNPLRSSFFYLPFNIKKSDYFFSNLDLIGPS